MSDPATREFKIHRRFMAREVLGEGATATVVAATESPTGLPVAIKELKPEHRDEQEIRRRFQQEATIAALVDHSGALAVYGEGLSGEDLPFYAMQQVDGETLADVLAQRESAEDRFWLERLLNVFAEACATVAYAHERGIVHRDIKPDNLLLSADGTTHLLDWGSARRLGTEDSEAENREAEGLIIGTPGYMAPEQARGDSAAAGTQADVFSLGVVLYEILTGVSPFLGTSLEESLSRVLHRAPEHPTKHSRWIPRGLAAICMRALELDPFRRYADAGALGRDLRDYRAGRPIETSKLSLSERLRGFGRRRPGAAATVAALSLLFVIAFSALITGMAVEAQAVRRDLAATRRLDERSEALKERAQAVAAEIAAARAGSVPPSDLEALEHRQRALETRRLMRQLEAVVILREVARLHLVRGGSEREEAIWDRIDVMIETALSAHHPIVGLGVIDTLLELEKQGELRLHLSAERRHRLDELRRRATEMASPEGASSTGDA